MAPVDQGPLVAFFTCLPLYKLAAYADGEVWQPITAIHEYDGRFDAYCPECKEMATLVALRDEEYVNAKRLESAVMITSSSGRNASRPTPFWKRLDFKKRIQCTRAHHVFTFYFRRVNGGFMKVGQYPSLADMATGEVLQYRKVLGEENSRALMKAIGLHAHGVGAGALIYLRRIFESLVEEAHELAKADDGWNENEYRSARMNERLKMLSKHLPEQVSSNHQFYSVFSEHIHSMPEETCLANFNVAKEGILVIADEKLVAEQRKVRAAAYQRAQNELASASAKQAASKPS